MSYWFRVGRQFSIFWNVVFLGKEDEPLCARCARSKCRFCRWLCFVMSCFQDRHCHESNDYLVKGKLNQATTLIGEAIILMRKEQ